MLMEPAPRTYAHGAGLLRFRKYIYMLAEAAPPAYADVPASMSTGSRTRHHDHKIMAPALSLHAQSNRLHDHPGAAEPHEVYTKMQ